MLPKNTGIRKLKIHFHVLRVFELSAKLMGAGRSNFIFKYFIGWFLKKPNTELFPALLYTPNILTQGEKCKTNYFPQMLKPTNSEHSVHIWFSPKIQPAGKFQINTCLTSWKVFLKLVSQSFLRSINSWVYITLTAPHRCCFQGKSRRKKSPELTRVPSILSPQGAEMPSRDVFESREKFTT